MMNSTTGNNCIVCGGYMVDTITRSSAGEWITVRKCCTCEYSYYPYTWNTTTSDTCRIGGT